MSKDISIKKRISSMLDLPKELVIDLPVISMVGSEEFNIENYKGVVEYTDEKIRISTSCGILKLEGRNLCLKQITAENITVAGNITKLEYLL